MSSIKETTTCLQNESLDFIEILSKFFAVNYMKEFDKSNDYNRFFHP